MSTPTAFWLAGRQATGEDSFDVTNAWDGRVVGTVSVPTAEQVEEAVAAAHAAEAAFAATPAHVRSAALDHVAKRMTERSEEIAQLISAENGKPVKWARGEVAARSRSSGGRRRRPVASTAVRRSGWTPTRAASADSR